MQVNARKLHAQDSNSGNLSNKPKNELTVFVSNLSEDVWPFIQAMTEKKAYDYELAENAALADLHLFSNADEHDLVFISPVPLDSDLTTYFRDLFEFKNLIVMNPTIHQGQTCLDVIADKDLLKNLEKIAADYKKVTLLSYSASEQFYVLKHKLMELGLPIYTPESPAEESAWTVNFLGSKSGIRQLAQKGQAEDTDFVIADGLICVGIFDAAKIAADKYLREGGVVLKTNKGHSGAGVLIFREGELPEDFDACEKKLTEIMARENYWNKFPIIIEDLVNVNTAVGGGFPNVEYKIQKSGEINFLYCCGLRVTQDGIFQGTEINDEVINERYLARIMDLGFYIGEEYAKMGYRGYFDVDFIAGKNGKIYVSESNTRRTGGTFAYKTAEELIGEDFLKDAYIVHENGKFLGERFRITYAELLKIMKPLLFNKKTNKGIVFPSANLLKYHKLAYIIFADNEKHNLELEEKMNAILKKYI